MSEKIFISLNELAKELEINKSKLSHYVKFGLLHPEAIVGRMQIFKHKDSLKILNSIKKWQGEGYTLQQIKEKLKQ